MLSKTQRALDPSGGNAQGPPAVLGTEGLVVFLMDVVVAAHAHECLLAIVLRLHFLYLLRPTREVVGYGTAGVR